MKVSIIAVFVLFLAAPAFAQTCDIPAGYINQIETTEGDIWVGFATDKAVYEPGDVMEFYLVVKNTGVSSWYLNCGYDPQNAFYVMADSCASITQPGCFDYAVYYHPFMVFFFSVGTTLEPGECRVWTQAWDTNQYVPQFPPVDGMYHVFGGMCGGYMSSELGWQIPSNGLMLTIEIDSSIPVEETTWGRVKTLYR